MRVDLSSSAAIEIANEQRSQQIASQKTPASGQATGEDRTSLSSSSNSTESLVGVAMTSPTVRQDKVDALRQAISSGQYELNPGNIASAMIDEQA
jgi:negative regulator of flagellin synthesis FlgM